MSEILDEIEKAVARGVTTWELHGLAEKLIYQMKLDFGGVYRGFSVVRDFTGHGIGRHLHYGQRGCGMKFRPGVVLAVEPMVNQGTSEVELLDDDWTAVTLDNKLSAHFEHTVLITEGGRKSSPGAGLGR